MSVWEAMDNYPREISLCVNWIDDNGLDDFKSYNANDLATFKHTLQNIRSKYTAFDSVTLHVKPNGSSSSIIERLTKTTDKHYNTDQLKNIIIPLIDWINKRPEMLI